MLTLETITQSGDRASRRTLLKAGFLGIGSLPLAELLRLESEAAPAPSRNDTAVILLWCGGGPSQLETYDMKPDAPADLRGPLNPTRTNVPGIDYSKEVAGPATRPVRLCNGRHLPEWG